MFTCIMFTIEDINKNADVAIMIFICVYLQCRDTLSPATHIHTWIKYLCCTTYWNM